MTSNSLNVTPQGPLLELTPVAVYKEVKGRVHPYSLSTSCRGTSKSLELASRQCRLAAYHLVPGVGMHTKQGCSAGCAVPVKGLQPAPPAGHERGLTTVAGPTLRVTIDVTFIMYGQTCIHKYIAV